jgi:hypothetical protein
MLHNAASTLLKSRDCEGARALLPELKRYNKDDAVKAIEHDCH